MVLSLGNTFTQADIDAGLVSYTHDNSDTTSDRFQFTATDGNGGAIGPTDFAITIIPPFNLEWTREIESTWGGGSGITLDTAGNFYFAGTAREIQIQRLGEEELALYQHLVLDCQI